mgnify:CR=1 FL=1
MAATTISSHSAAAAHAGHAASGPSASGLAPQQRDALEAMLAWFAASGPDAPIFRLFGYAGTGKTTLARHLAHLIQGKVLYAAYTGKAALQLARAGCPRTSTLHSLIYTTKTLPDGRMAFRVNPRSELRDAALLVVDECSMVDEAMARDILGFGVPIVALGDPAQLQPHKGKGYFTSVRPDAMLTEIHRQARDNPIIRIATDIRQGRALNYGDHGTVRILRRGTLTADDLLAHDQILVGKRATKDAFAARLRTHQKRKGPIPEPGEKLVCLRNDAGTGIFNGGLYTVLSRHESDIPDHVGLTVRSIDLAETPPIRVSVHEAFFTGEADTLSPAQRRDSAAFESGLALTGHKAQGSQWPDVIAYDESGCFGNQARAWLYTVVTRAQNRLTLVR